MTYKPDDSWRVVFNRAPGEPLDGLCQGFGLDSRKLASCEGNNRGYAYVLPDGRWWHVRCFERSSVKVGAA